MHLVLTAAELGRLNLVGVSVHLRESRYLMPRLMSLLRERGSGAHVVAGGTIVTAADAARLRAMGVTDHLRRRVRGQTAAQATQREHNLRTNPPQLGARPARRCGSGVSNL